MLTPFTWLLDEFFHLTLVVLILAPLIVGVEVFPEDKPLLLGLALVGYLASVTAILIAATRWRDRRRGDDGNS